MDAVAFCHLRRLGLTVQIVRRRHRGIARSPSARLPEMSSRAVRNRRELGRWPQNHPRSEQCEDLTRFPGTRNPKFEGRNPKADKEGAITETMSAAIHWGALGMDAHEHAWGLEVTQESWCFPVRATRGVPAYVSAMSKFSTAAALELPVPERLQLVEDIWNSIADLPEALEITDEEKRLIDERLEDCHRHPGVGSPWEEVYARITSQKK